MKKLAVPLLIAAGLLGINTGVEAEGEIPMALSLLWVIAVLWLTEAFHITITAFLVPVLAVLAGLLSMPDAMANFGHPIIFLFLGGFALASAMQVQGLDRWLADGILTLTGGRLSRAVVLLGVASALLSMWISNTAVAALMLPLILGLMAENPDLSRRTQAYCLMVVAFSANIGGMGTIIGSPPNALVAAELGLTFAQWLQIGVPAVLLLWPLMMAVLWLVSRPVLGEHRIEHDPAGFRWTRERKILIAIFLLAVGCWLFGQPLSGWLGIGGNFDTWVAIAAMILACGTRVVAWKDIEKSANWGVLMLFGGGLTLSAVLQASGASVWLGERLAVAIDGWSLLLVIAALVAFVVFLTEIASNTATTALLVPVFVALPIGSLEPAAAAIAIGLASSCAFMLPVATPPNAMVHGTGRIEQRDMMRNGIFINLACIAALTVLLAVTDLG